VLLVHTVEAQHEDRESMLRHYRKGLRLRRRESALRHGDFRLLSAPEACIGFERAAAAGECVACALNLESTRGQLPWTGELILTSGDLLSRPGGIELGADAAAWLKS
jgi:hypothetical protein